MNRSRPIVAALARAYGCAFFCLRFETGFPAPLCGPFISPPRSNANRDGQVPREAVLRCGRLDSLDLLLRTGSARHSAPSRKRQHSIRQAQSLHFKGRPCVVTVLVLAGACGAHTTSQCSLAARRRAHQSLRLQDDNHKRFPTLEKTMKLLLALASAAALSAPTRLPARASA